MFKVNRDKCIGCSQCVNDCPTRVISLVDNIAEINNKNCLKCGHCIAICPLNAVSTDDYSMDEVIPYNEDSFLVSPDNLLNFIKFRRSVRKFKNKKVEKDKVSKIIDAGRFTQTSTNSQDVSYIVITEKLDELRLLTYESLKNKGESILSNLNNNNLTPETERLKKYAYMWVNMYDEYKIDPIKNDRLFFNAPLAIVVTSPTSINASLASSNMELMTDALGLGTFFCGFFVVASQNNEKILDLLGIDDNKEIVTCLLIGYPDVQYKRTTPRKDAQIKWL